MSLLNDLRRIAGLIRTEGMAYPLGLGALGVVNLSDVIAPLFMALAIELTQSFFTGEAPNTPPPMALVGLDGAQFSLVSAVGIYLGLQILASVCRYPMMMKVAVPSYQITQTLRRRLAGYLLRQGQSWYDRSRSGDIMSIATADIQAVRMMLGPGVMITVDTVMLVSLVLVMLGLLSWKLMLVTLLPVPLLLLFTNRLSNMEFTRFLAVQRDLSRMTERVRESYAGIRIIQGYAREEHDRARFAGYSREHFDKNMSLARVRSVFDPTLDLLLGLSTALVLIFGGMEVARGEMTLGTFVAFLFLIRYLSGPMVGLGWSISLLQRGRASLQRIDELCETPLEVVDGAGARQACGPGGIEVRGLTFQYTGDRVLEDGEVQKAPEYPVLQDVSFSLNPGRRLGIFGPVGCGKSTLVSVLTRLYEPPAGTVFLDGVDVRELTLDSLREQIVLAPQETFLFSSTIARNMVMTQEELLEDPDELRRIATLANLQAEIERFEEGYETLLGERGTNLSGGQRQRLAIARAIAADPRVLVLDDCLSAVDSKTEAQILANLRQVLSGRTGIIVSHRVRAVQDCDEIIVLEEGRVVARGTHDELRVGDGYYARIAREQMQSTEAA